MKRDNGWHLITEDDNKYAYKGDQWISLEDMDTIRAKAEYVRNENIFGAAVYPINYDDATNGCGDGRYPLLNEVHRVLAPKTRIQE